MGNAIDLNGWDTVFAASYTTVNQAIVKAGSTPAGFNDSDSGTETTINGTWGPWQICNGGDGRNLQMKCPIVSGKATSSLSMFGPAVDLSGASLTIQVNLKFVPDPSSSYVDPTGSRGTPHKLKVDTVGSDGNKPATVMQLTCTDLTDLQQALLQPAFQAWFDAHLADFDHVFAVMLLGEVSREPELTWLKPTTASYAVADTGDPDTSVFAVLAMTDGDPVGDNAHQVDSNILKDLPAGANSMFAINPRKVLKHILQPGAMHLIQGSKSSQFEIVNDGLGVVNNEAIAWGNFDFDDDTVVPNLPGQGFNLGLDAEEVNLTITGASYHAPEWKGPGYIGVTVNLQQTFEFETKQRTDGKFVFVTKVSPTDIKSITADVAASKGVLIFDILIGIGTSIVLCALGPILSKAAALASTLGQSAVEGAVTLTADAVEDAVGQAAQADIEELESSAADAADEAAASDSPTLLQKAVGMIAANKYKILIAMVSAMCGAVAGNAGNIAKAMVQGNLDEMPTIDNFAANCIGAVQWSNTKEWQLVYGRLSGALLMAGSLTGA